MSIQNDMLGAGDDVTLYMPMIPELPAAMVCNISQQGSNIIFSLAVKLVLALFCVSV